MILARESRPEGAAGGGQGEVRMVEVFRRTPGANRSTRPLPLGSTFTTFREDSRQTHSVSLKVVRIEAL